MQIKRFFSLVRALDQESLDILKYAIFPHQSKMINPKNFHLKLSYNAEKHPQNG